MPLYVSHPSELLWCILRLPFHIFLLFQDRKRGRSIPVLQMHLKFVEAAEEVEFLRNLIQNHADYTGSKQAFKVLALWEEKLPKFVKVMPKDYKRVLQALKKAQQSGLSGDDALNAAFEENSKDVARIGGG